MYKFVLGSDMKSSDNKLNISQFKPKTNDNHTTQSFECNYEWQIHMNRVPTLILFDYLDKIQVWKEFPIIILDHIN